MQPGKSTRCSIEDLYMDWSAQNECQFIDVREYSEFNATRIPGTVHVPLTAIAHRAQSLNRNMATYVICQWGNRSKQAAQELVKLGFTDVRVVEGGLLAWTAAELPIEKGTSKVWSLERQVRFTAGALALSGALLAWLVHPYFIGLSGFIGTGLVFAAVTDTCGMALVLAKMPWNQQPTCESNIANQAEAA